MRTDILDYLEGELYARCHMPSNTFCEGIYGHVASVVKNGWILAKQYGADKEVVQIAAWLHDIASITDASLYEMHHIHGAEMARDILSRFDYDEDKLRLVQACIRNHRGSVRLEKNSVEEICVADADAASHFSSIPSLLYLAYGTRQMGLEAGLQFVRGKLERSFRKMSPKSQAFYSQTYQNALEFLTAG